MKKYIETVGELISELEKYPLDMKVFDYGLAPIEKIWYEKEIPLGDSANPKCELTEGIIIE